MTLGNGGDSTKEWSEAGARELAITRLMKIAETPIDPKTITFADRAAAIKLVGELGTRDWVIAKLVAIIAQPIDPKTITATAQIEAIRVLGKIVGWLPNEDLSDIPGVSDASSTTKQ
jgi:hypothetical protein